MKKRLGHGVSVRKEGTIIQVRMFDCNDSHDIFFKGEARVNNEKELKRLFQDAKDKGLIDF